MKSAERRELNGSCGDLLVRARHDDAAQLSKHAFSGRLNACVSRLFITSAR
jgi:hypothetical protein